MYTLVSARCDDPTETDKEMSDLSAACIEAQSVEEEGGYAYVTSEEGDTIDHWNHALITDDLHYKEGI